MVVNREAKRFYDEGEDFWPKRYAIWGRLVAHQPGQIAWSVIDQKSVGRFMPPVFPGTKANTLQELAALIGVDVAIFMETLNVFNAACRPGTFDHTALDDCRTEGLTPAKTHWARPIETPPFYAYPVRPGITFTYLGMKDRCDGGGALQGRAEPEPVRRRRNDGRQRARQGLHRRRWHEHRHRIRPYRRRQRGAKRGLPSSGIQGGAGLCRRSITPPWRRDLSPISLTRHATA